MSTDFESALLTKILDDRDIRSVIKEKLTSEFMYEPTCKAAFLYLMAWYNNPNYGDVPSWETFLDSFSHFEINRVDESMKALCDKVRERKIYSDVASLIQEVADVTSGDPLGGFDLLKNKVVSLTAAHTVDETSTVKSSIGLIRSEYMAMKEGATGLKGYPYPWPALNEATLGLQAQQLVFVYGRPKTKKTWIILYMAVHLWRHGLRPIIFSQELSDIEIKRRFVALATGVNYDKFLRGTLPADIEAEFFDNLDIFEESEEVPVSILSAGESCIPDLTSKIDEYRANVVLIDGFNYLSTDWKELAEITRAVKRVGQAKKLPLIASTHANRSRNKKADTRDAADDFAYGDSFYQTCDLALRVTSDIEDLKARQVKLFTSAIREGKSVEFTIHTYLAENMTQKAIQRMGLAENDIEDELAQDALDGESDLPEAAE